MWDSLYLLPPLIITVMIVLFTAYEGYHLKLSNATSQNMIGELWWSLIVTVAGHIVIGNKICQNNGGGKVDKAKQTGSGNF